MEEPKRWYISSVAGSTISGAKGSELMAAVGAMVPSSTIRPTATPRAAYFRKRRSPPRFDSRAGPGPSEALIPHMFLPYPCHCFGFAMA